MQIENDIPRQGRASFRRLDSLPTARQREKGKLPRRSDIPASSIPGSTGFAIATEWLGRVAAAMAVILFVLVMMSIHKGLLVQHSARTLVNNFRDTNQMFTDRADLTAPATARKQLDELKGILTQLNSATATDVDHLAALLPNMEALLSAGQGDTQIANQLQTVATTLEGSAGSLRQISSAANTTVSQVNDELTQVIALVNQLNAELTRTTNKVAPIPAQDALIPAHGGHR
uniref:Uncharacterized protein orf4 n=1 Tax=Rhodococcus erythropolis TaxID=1833 RepID=A3KD06_RHOER|nr:hypothetical protein [Rhodococcus erythropolis]